MSDAQRGWIYAIELKPAGCVKVGRTDNLGKRLNDHIGNAHFGGGAVSRTYSVACADSQQAERVLLSHLNAHPSVTVWHGRETFQGLPFETIRELMDGIGAISATPNAPLPSGALLSACAAVMDENDAQVISLGNLCALLVVKDPAAWASFSPRLLGAHLRASGVQPRTVYCANEDIPGSQRSGSTNKGIRRQWIADAARRAA